MVVAGELVTTATWIRKQVHSHPDYKHDSTVSNKMTFDLIQAMRGVTDGTVPCPELLGSLISRGTETPTLLLRDSDLE